MDQMRMCLKELKLLQRPPQGFTKLDACYESAFAVLVDAGGGSALMIEEMRYTCNLIEQVHSQFLLRFGLYMVLNLLNSLVSICVELYLIFNFFETPLWEESVLLVYRLLWLAMHGGRIWFILAVNEQILEQVVIHIQV